MSEEFVQVPRDGTGKKIRTTVATVDGELVHQEIVQLVDESNAIVGVQSPLSIDGDSVYPKDIDEDKSSIGTFTGNILHLATGVSPGIIDSTSTDPKNYTVYMNRPITTSEITVASQIGYTFSNMKLYLYDCTGSILLTIDNSSDDTKYTKYVFADIPQTFIGFKIEFHTSDTVGIAFNYVRKSVSVIARIQGISDSTGLLEDVKTDNGEFIVGGKVGLKNVSNTNINPATTEKQDQIISALGGTTNESLRVDDATTTDISYIGNAVIAASEAGAIWKIKILDETTSVMKILWADGNENYDNIWTNRASLSYS